MTIMVLVADSSRARLFTADAALASSDLNEIDSLAHPEGRLHEQDLVSDLPGKDSGNGTGGHAYQVQTEPKEQDAINFAKRIAKTLEASHNANKFAHLVVVSAPAFLGTLRKQFSDQVRKLVRFELDKNLTVHSVEDIRKHLPKYLTHD
ncbi:MAG: host attachment protein [Gammaproteobacteria bacterium]|nr:host attachment protein [Gammaproteobacteria bacterium]